MEPPVRIVALALMLSATGACTDSTRHETRPSADVGAAPSPVAQVPSDAAASGDEPAAPRPVSTPEGRCGAWYDDLRRERYSLLAIGPGTTITLPLPSKASFVEACLGEDGGVSACIKDGGDRGACASQEDPVLACVSGGDPPWECDPSRTKTTREKRRCTHPAIDAMMREYSVDGIEITPIDLDGDGPDDARVTPNVRSCGAVFCSALLYHEEGGCWRLVGDFANSPVRLSVISKGLHDVSAWEIICSRMFNDEGDPFSNFRFAFDGDRYVAKGSSPCRCSRAACGRFPDGAKELREPRADPSRPLGVLSPPGADQTPTCEELYSAITLFREVSVESETRRGDSVIPIAPVALPSEREFIEACQTLPEAWRRCLHPERSGQEECFDLFEGAGPQLACPSLSLAVILRPQGQVAHGVERVDLDGDGERDALITQPCSDFLHPGCPTQAYLVRGGCARMVGSFRGLVRQLPTKRHGLPDLAERHRDYCGDLGALGNESDGFTDPRMTWQYDGTRYKLSSVPCRCMGGQTLCEGDDGWASIAETPHEGVGAGAPSKVDVADLAPEDIGFEDHRGGRGWGNRCFVHLKAKRYAPASAACRRGLEIATEGSIRGAILYNLGRIAEEQGHVEEARRQYRSSLRERPGNKTVQARLKGLSPAEQ